MVLFFGSFVRSADIAMMQKQGKLVWGGTKVTIKVGVPAITSIMVSTCAVVCTRPTVLFIISLTAIVQFLTKAPTIIISAVTLAINAII